MAVAWTSSADEGLHRRAGAPFRSRASTKTIATLMVDCGLARRAKIVDLAEHLAARKCIRR